MRVTVLILSFLFSFSSYSQSDVVSVQEKNNQVSTSNATIDFESKVVDYGTIAHGSDGNREFTFTNNGSEPLIIKNARASCGCTVPDYPKNIPIKPGDKGDIKVKFDSTKKPGNQMKTVTLTTNTKRGRDIIRIKTNVVSPLSN